MAVSDSSVKEAMHYGFEALKVVLEPSGAIAIAALLDGSIDAEGRRVLAYATGGNVSFDAFARHVENRAD